MKKAALIALGVGLLAGQPAAQPMHGHPQVALSTPAIRAANPVSFQGHWPNPDPTMTCHLHVDALDFPYGAELGADPFEVHFALKLFMCDGRLGAFWGDSFLAITWDATGGTTMPVMQGDTFALKQWTGKILIDPAKGRFAHRHGWTGVPFNGRIGFSNNDEMTVQGIDSFFSLIDPSAPEVAPPGGFGPVLSTRVDVKSAATGLQFGTMITEIDSWIPLLPIADTWHTILNFYNYTAPPNRFLEPTGRFEQRVNLDLHAGIRGVLTDSAVANKQGIPNRDIVFDPAQLTVGVNTIAEFWTQTLDAETVSSLIVIKVSKAGSAPLLCEDPTATNVGGPLPCVFPVVPVWAPITAFFERFGSEDRYRLCDAFHLSCRELVFK